MGIATLIHTKPVSSPLSMARTLRVRIGLVLIALGLVVVAIASVGLGAVAIGPGQVLAIVASKIGVALPWTFETQQEMVLTAIRLPRVLLGILVGGGLAVSGAIMQGLFRNPLADPGLVGVSSGAAFSAVSVIVLSSVVGFSSAWSLPVAAFLGGVVTTLLVYKLATQEGQTSVATMLLAGIAVNALAAAGTGVFIFMADDAQLRDITFWTLGSIGGATWDSLAVVAPFLLLPILLAPFLARSLNALLLGEAEARHLGIEVEKIKLGVVILTGLGVGAAVAVSGIIGFVGLVVPHLLRLLLGPDHRYLIPGSALLGASLLLLADLLARTIVAPAELPIGIVTAFVGAPFFLWLLLRGRSKGQFTF